MAVTVNPEFSSPALEKFINGLPDSFDNAGKELYNGRNIVKSFVINGQELIVKRFKKLSFFRALLYLGRTSKATRAYRYGLEILKRGVITPEPVAVINKRHGILLHDSYFISLPLHRPDMTFIRNKDFDRHEAKMLAAFVYELQQRGILHGDMNMTNILLADSNAVNPLERYAIIDTNRSVILPQGKQPTIRQRAKNLMRLTHRRDLMRAVLSSFPLPSPHNSLVTNPTNSLVRITFLSLFRQEHHKRILHRLFPH